MGKLYDYVWYKNWCKILVFDSQVVQKTAATFAPRASTATKNPAVPGTTLYTVFEVQGYVSMLLGGALSFNLLFPSTEPDIWRLMGMWSIWMFSKFPHLFNNFLMIVYSVEFDCTNDLISCCLQQFRRYEHEIVRKMRRKHLTISSLSFHC